MPRPSQKERDELIFSLHNGTDSEKPKSFGDLARTFKISKVAVFEAYWKEAVRRGMEPPKSLSNFKKKYR